MISKIIHYCWFGGNPLPELAKECIASWRKFLPDYEIWQWRESTLHDNDDDNDNLYADKVMPFDVNIIPYTEEAYKQKKYAFVSDYARFWIMYKYGGIYFDTDVEVIRPMHDIISRGNFMGFEMDPDGENTPGKYAPRYCFDVNTGLGFGIVGSHPFLKNMLDLYNSLVFSGVKHFTQFKTVVAYTTEMLVTKGLENKKGIQYVDDILIYPREYFAPINVVTGRLKITENTRTIHRYAGSWDDRKKMPLKAKIRHYCPEWVLIMANKIKRRKYRLLGYKHVHPSCHLGGHVKVFTKDNLVMAEQSNINANAVIMNTRAKFIMGKYSGAAMNLFVVTGNHMSVPGLSKREVTNEVKDKLDINHEYDRDVVVDEDVWIGANVMLLAGSHICRGAIVGAGSVVRGNVPPYSIVSGNPAKVTSYRFRLDEILYHEEKLYPESERLDIKDIEKDYYKFYGSPSKLKSNQVFTIDEYREVFQRAFGIKAESAEQQAKNVSEEWDSLGHTKLVVEIENTFGVKISTNENRQLTTYQKGIEILAQKGIKFKEEKIAYVFPGQGAQFVGMGKDLYESNDKARILFEKANNVLGFRITDLMFNGTDADLLRTEVTQPAVYLCSVIPFLVSNVKPLMVAGHSLGEFSALVACGALSFEDGLILVSKRAQAMQSACDTTDGAMAAALQREIKVSDEQIIDICKSVEGVVVAANFNCPGQVIISGEKSSVETACNKLIDSGVKKTILLKVNGAFHSPLMEQARVKLADAINKVEFKTPNCPIYQNVDAKPHSDISEIKDNLLVQLTNPVRWQRSIENMISNGVSVFVESGPGDVLCGMISKINKDICAKHI